MRFSTKEELFAQLGVQSGETILLDVGPDRCYVPLESLSQVVDGVAFQVIPQTQGPVPQLPLHELKQRNEGEGRKKRRPRPPPLQQQQQQQPSQKEKQHKERVQVQEKGRKTRGEGRRSAASRKQNVDRSGESSAVEGSSVVMERSSSSQASKSALSTARSSVTEEVCDCGCIMPGNSD